MAPVDWFLLVIFSRISYVTPNLQLSGVGSNFADALYQASIVTYLATNTNTDTGGLGISYVGMGSAQGICRLEDYVGCAVTDNANPHFVDFAASDIILKTSDYTEFEDLQMFPTAAGAVVPVYNLPSLASNDTLVLTSDILAKIYLKNITHWSDPLILSINPTIQAKLEGMLDTGIKVCGRGDSTGTSLIFTEYISECSATSVPEFSSKVGVSALPLWTNDTHLANKEVGMAAFVSQQTGALGYIGLHDAQMYELSMASILKPDGSIVAPSITSLAYAAAEYGMSFGNNGDSPEHLTADLHNAKAALAWPIAGYTYLVMRKNLTRLGETCLNRYETVKFWYWFYTSQAAYLLINLYGFVPLSETARAIVSKHLEADIYCNGRMVFKAIPPAPISLGITPFFLDNMRFMWEGAYLSVSPESSFTYYMVNQSTVIDQYDIVIFKGRPFQIQSDKPLSDFVNFPFAGIAYVFLINICGPDSPHCTENSVNARNFTFTMTGDMIYRILSGQILFWNDPEIVAWNPAFSVIPHKISLVLSEPVLDDLEVLNFAFPEIMSAFVFDSSKLNSGMVATEVDAYLQVTQVPYTMTCLHLTTELATITQLPLWENPLLLGSIVRADGASVYPSMDSMQPCTTDTYTEASNKFDFLSSKNPGCYPLTLSYRFISKRDYLEQVCNAKSVAVQNAEFLAWIFKRGPLSEAYTSFQMLPLFSLNDKVYKKTKDELLSITCNGVSLLAVPANYSYISGWATPFAWALSALVTLLGAGFMGWLFLHRTHKVIKFAQPEFLCFIILGAVMMAFSVVPLSLDDRDVEYYSLDNVLNLNTQSRRLNRACMVVPWLYVTGFALEFSALLAKVWRLKKIFLAKQLQRVRQTVRDTVPILAACLFTGWCFCAAWTGAAPLQWARTAVTFDSNGFMVDSYAHCTSEAFAKFYGVLTALELGCLFYGMVLCYQTRNVQEEFVENKWITIVLINMMSTVLLTVLLGFFMRQNPSALFAIELINVMMTGGGVMCVMIIPKIQMVWKMPKQQGPSVVNQSIQLPGSNHHPGHPMSNASNKVSMSDQRHSNISHRSSPTVNSMFSQFRRALKKTAPTKSNQLYD